MRNKPVIVSLLQTSTLRQTMLVNKPTPARHTRSMAACLVAFLFATSSVLADVKLADRSLMGDRTPEATLEVEDEALDGTSILKVKRDVMGAELTILDVTNDGLVTIDSGTPNDSGLRFQQLTSASATTAASERLGVDATGKVVMHNAETPPLPLTAYENYSTNSFGLVGGGFIQLDGAVEHNTGAFTLSTNQTTLTTNIAGTYWIEYLAPWTSLGTNATFTWVQLLINSAMVSESGSHVNYDQGFSSSTHMVSDVVDLDVGDYIQLFHTGPTSYYYGQQFLIFRMK
ncbi:hypothetical protein OAS86_06855 [Gammaproteobacteria bacterium]|nr:hypothetical protein [Gammaproteobacteria bacterium]